MGLVGFVKPSLIETTRRPSLFYAAVRTSRRRPALEGSLFLQGRKAFKKDTHYLQAFGDFFH